jgi:UDP-N-acetylmuramate dehydrogenase
MRSFERALGEAVGPERVRTSVPLAPFTTFRVGGAADYFLEARNAREVQAALTAARSARVPAFVFGGGSNLLVADAGVRGLVVRVHGGEVTQTAEDRIRADAGVTINGLVRWTIGRGLAALESWAGTPGTVGGAVFGNAHFQGRLIGDLITSVRVIAYDTTVVDVPAADMEFGYDYSRLHRTREVVVSADFAVTRGDPAALRALARESLAYRKRTQPLESASAGCIFQNPDPARDSLPDGIPWSAGALVDRAGMKGAREGRTAVSMTHANFIVNEGGASADDIRRLIDRCKAAVLDRFGVELREEIVYLGFEIGEPESVGPEVGPSGPPGA